jgi:preprotein translocase subunit SecY
MLSAFVNIFKITELRQRILFTLGLIFICRFIAAVPLPGVDAVAIREYFAQQDVEGGMLGMINLFSGGALLNASIGTLGIMPYISASIILQLMTAVVPQLSKLSRDGDIGRQKITQYTRYLTVILCAVQGFGLAVALVKGNFLGTGLPASVVQVPPVGFIFLSVISIIAATLLIMWIGEQITERGIGNGISLIITINIISELPSAIITMVELLRPVDGIAQIGAFHVILMLAIFFIVVVSVVAITQAQQRVPVQYAKRVVGRKMYGGQHTYMPLRVNYSGVMPIIFAGAIMGVPAFLFGLMPWDWSQAAASMFQYGSFGYMMVFGLMILFFSYFWVATQFNPIQIADDLKKHGGYIPGIRPGTATADYLDRTMTRITLAGAVFLTILAILPTVMTNQFKIPMNVTGFFGGTSMLIIVGVMLDTMRQIESHLLMRHYDGFLKKGKMRGRK